MRAARRRWGRVVGHGGVLSLVTDGDLKPSPGQRARLSRLWTRPRCRPMLAPPSLRHAGRNPMPDDQHMEAAPARSDFTVKKGDVSLAVYRKRLEPERGAPARPVLFLVHGSSNSALSS